MIIVLSWPIAVLNAYVGYRYIVFRSRGSVVRELPRFSLVYVAALIANLALLPIALRVLPFSIYVDQALFFGVVVVVQLSGPQVLQLSATAGHEDIVDGSVYDPQLPESKD